MKRRAYGYGTYRGRGRGSLGLKIIIAILALVLFLAVAGFFLLERYMVYDDNGQARLELPFLSSETKDPSPSPSPSQLPPIVTQTPEPEKPTKPEVILPVSLPLEGLYDGSAAEAVTEAGGTAALFDMKPESGMLAWVSDETLAIQARVSAGDPELNEAIKAEAEKNEVYRIARVSCFKDQELSNADTTLAITTGSGYRWLDSEKHRWLSPYDERVQEYLVGLCKELAQLGFDEILLDHAGYPTRGRLGYIRKDAAYDEAQFETVISGFYTKLAEAVGEQDVVLSVVYDHQTTALSGQSEKTLSELGITIVSREEDGKLIWGTKQAAE